MITPHDQRQTCSHNIHKRAIEPRICKTETSAFKGSSYDDGRPQSAPPVLKIRSFMASHGDTIMNKPMIEHAQCDPYRNDSKLLQEQVHIFTDQPSNAPNLSIFEPAKPNLTPVKLQEKTPRLSIGHLQKLTDIKSSPNVAQNMPKKSISPWHSACNADNPNKKLAFEEHKKQLARMSETTDSNYEKLASNIELVGMEDKPGLSKASLRELLSCAPMEESAVLRAGFSDPDIHNHRGELFADSSEKRINMDKTRGDSHAAAEIHQNSTQNFIMASTPTADNMSIAAIEESSKCITNTSVEKTPQFTSRRDDNPVSMNTGRNYCQAVTEILPNLTPTHAISPTTNSQSLTAKKSSHKAFTKTSLKSTPQISLQRQHYVFDDMIAINTNRATTGIHQNSIQQPIMLQDRLTSLKLDNMTRTGYKESSNALMTFSTQNTHTPLQQRKPLSGDLRLVNPDPETENGQATTGIQNNFVQQPFMVPSCATSPISDNITPVAKKNLCNAFTNIFPEKTHDISVEVVNIDPEGCQTTAGAQHKMIPSCATPPTPDNITPAAKEDFCNASTNISPERTLDTSMRLGNIDREDSQSITRIHQNTMPSCAASSQGVSTNTSTERIPRKPSQGQPLPGRVRTANTEDHQTMIGIQQPIIMSSCATPPTPVSTLPEPKDGPGRVSTEISPEWTLRTSLQRGQLLHGEMGTADTAREDFQATTGIHPDYIQQLMPSCATSPTPENMTPAASDSLGRVVTHTSPARKALQAQPLPDDGRLMSAERSLSPRPDNMTLEVKEEFGRDSTNTSPGLSLQKGLEIGEDTGDHMREGEGSGLFGCTLQQLGVISGFTSQSIETNHADKNQPLIHQQEVAEETLKETGEHNECKFMSSSADNNITPVPNVLSPMQSNTPVNRNTNLQQPILDDNIDVYSIKNPSSAPMVNTSIKGHDNVRRQTVVTIGGEDRLETRNVSSYRPRYASALEELDDTKTVPETVYYDARESLGLSSFAPTDVPSHTNSGETVKQYQTFPQRKGPQHAKSRSDNSEFDNSHKVLTSSDPETRVQSPRGSLTIARSQGVVLPPLRMENKIQPQVNWVKISDDPDGAILKMHSEH